MFYNTGFNPFAPPPLQKPAEPPKKTPPPPPGPPAPARMAILVGGGKEAMIALPPTYDKAIAATVAAFEIPPTFAPRLGVKDCPPWLQKFKDQDLLFIADDASYQYCISGRQVVRFEVMAFEKQGGGGPPKPAPASGSKCPVDIICENKEGKAFQLLASLSTDKDLTRNPPVGAYQGTLRITENPLKVEFVGRQV